MAKDKVESVEKVEVEREQALPVPAAPIKRVTFDQWANERGVKEYHKSGMKAFCSNPDKLRSFEEWDKSFEGY